MTSLHVQNNNTFTKFPYKYLTGNQWEGRRGRTKQNRNETKLKYVLTIKKNFFMFCKNIKYEVLTDFSDVLYANYI